MINGKEVRVDCGPPDDRGIRLVLASRGARSHRDRFNTDSAYHRERFRKAASDKLGLMMAQEVEDLERAIIASADETDSGADHKPLATPRLVGLDTVKAKQIHWFWDGRFPRGAIIDLHGDPGEAKSQIGLNLAARYSTGTTMPPHSLPGGCEPGNTLLLAAEDDLERTIKPRLQALDADMQRITHLKTVETWDGDERQIQLPLDLPVIEQVITEKNIGLVIVDVLSAFVQEGLNMNSDSDMRRLFSPVSALAERTQSTWLFLRHLNKKSGTSSMYRAGGSVAIIAAARAAFTVAPHPDNPATKVFAPVKFNLGPTPRSLTYTIEPAGGVSRVVWGGETDMSAHDILGSNVGGKSGSKVDAAKEIIEDVLGNGPRGSNEVEQEIERAGISKSTYWRARKELRVTAQKTDFDGQWLLSLPADDSEFQ